MDARVRQITAAMEESLHLAMTGESFAAQVNLSISHLRFLFKNETGQTLNQYFKSLRLGRAKILLETTSRSIKEIQSEVGIADCSHFSKEFKQVFGVTPKTYRQQSRVLRAPAPLPGRQVSMATNKKCPVCDAPVVETVGGFLEIGAYVNDAYEIEGKVPGFVCTGPVRHGFYMWPDESAVTQESLDNLRADYDEETMKKLRSEGHVISETASSGSSEGN